MIEGSCDFYYLSTISLDSSGAQSLQALQTAQALIKEASTFKKRCFVLYLGSELGFYDKNYIRVGRIGRSRIICNLRMFTYVLTREYNPSAIYFTRDSLVCLLLAICGLRVIVEVHHPGSAFNKLVFMGLANMKRVLFAPISYPLKAYLLEKYSINSSRAIVLSSTTDVSSYQEIDRLEAREHLCLPSHRFIVVHTGSAYIGRGVELYQYICNADPRILFIHVGGSELDIQRLVNDARDNGISNALFKSSCPRSEAMYYQKAADCLFYVITHDWPTYWCCSPLKIPEYLSCGVPIMAPSIGTIPEILGDCYVDYDVKMPITITSTLKRIMNDYETMKSLSARSLRRAIELYDNKTKVMKLLGLLND
jgi:glycosyltransferase involved in cell wall biosynthesis